MALPDFTDERDFRDNWIAPFLSKLGYIIVKNTHGAGEQGKDFFFADYDRFGFVRVSALQAKKGNIGSGDREIGDLLDQVKRCFGVRLRFHKGAHEQRVAAVYVMASGTISEKARERIHDWCVSEHFGENVFFLDGELIENKERFATYESDNKRRGRLLALRHELNRNVHFLRSQKEKIASLGEKFVFHVFRMDALSDVIGHPPFDTTDTLIVALERVWQLLSMFSSYVTPMNHKWSETDLAASADSTDEAIELAVRIMSECDAEIAKLNQRYSLAIIQSDTEGDNE